MELSPGPHCPDRLLPGGHCALQLLSPNKMPHREMSLLALLLKGDSGGEAQTPPGSGLPASCLLSFEFKEPKSWSSDLPLWRDHKLQKSSHPTVDKCKTSGPWGGAVNEAALG